MKSKSGKDIYKIRRVKPGSKFDKMLANDPFLRKKEEDADKFLREHPIPEWLLKIARGEA